MTVLSVELPPFGGMRAPQGHLPLVAMDVRAEIAGLLATTTVRQTFRNVLDEHIEATRRHRRAARRRRHPTPPRRSCRA